MNGVPFWKAKPFLAKLGETQIWTIKNESKFAHPFHLHGFFFLPLDEKTPAGPAAGVEGHAQRADRRNRPIPRACSTSARACGCSIATSSITPRAA